MALDVHSSLANSLSAPERAVAPRSRAAEPKATAAQSPPAAAAQGGPAADFSRYVEDTSNSGAGKAAGRASSAAPRKPMSGQITGSQGMIVTPAAAPVVTPVKAAPTAPAARAGDQAAEAAAGRETLRLRGGEAGHAEPAAQGDAGAEAGTTEGASSSQTVVVRVDGEGRGDTASDGSGDQQRGEEAKPAAEATAVAAVPEPPVPSAVSVPLVSVPLVSVPLVSVPAGVGLEVPEGGPLDEGASGDGASNPAVVATGSGAALRTVPGADAAKEAAAPPADEAAASDGETQPGMPQFVEARKVALAEGKALKLGGASGIDAAKEPGGIKASAEAVPEAPRGSHHDGFRFGGEVFAQVLEGFAGAHAANRGGGLLAQLDPTLAAQAQNARIAEMQRPTPLQMLPVEIGMQALRGAREFQIRLDPAELGRVDVRLHINDKGEVSASMIVERPETLQMLRRDATTLAQAFEQAGLKQGENALSFSLRGEGQGQPQYQQAGGGRGGQAEDPALSAQVTEIVSRRVLIPNASLDRVV